MYGDAAWSGATADIMSKAITTIAAGTLFITITLNYSVGTAATELTAYITGGAYADETVGPPVTTLAVGAGHFTATWAISVAAGVEYTVRLSHTSSGTFDRFNGSSIALIETAAAA